MSTNKSTIVINEVAFFVILLYISKATEVKEVYKWNNVNFTWPNQLVYQYSLQAGLYIPANNFPTNIKIYGSRIYTALGRYYSGTPVTLGYVPLKSNNVSPLVTPFPSWEMNVQCDCKTLQNVNAIDIDKNGIMWILDGLRHNNLTNCPSKLIIYNITSHKIISTYDFPSEGDQTNAYLGDIVIDGNFAYITDSNAQDPGIIVYSKKKNTSWKLRDASMFPDQNALTFKIGKSKFNYYHAVGPITVSPYTGNSKKNRFIFFSPVSSLNIYKLNVDVIQNRDLITQNSWRDYVHVAGTKADQSYNYVMNHNGGMYFCLLNKNALAKWNVDKGFRTASFVASNNMINWCTGAAFSRDHLYLISGNLSNYIINGVKPTIEMNSFRLLKISIKNKNKRNS